MRNAILLIAAAASLAACGKTSITHKGTPDELAIGRNAPLVVPPDFNLQPPRPGEARPIGVDSQTQAMEALFGPGVKAPPKSAAEQQLLDRAGASKADPAIRSQAGDPKTPTVNKGAFLRELVGARAATRDPKTASVTITG
jgi:hypothetical protein